MQAPKQEALCQVHVQELLPPKRKHEGRLRLRPSRAVTLLARDVQAMLPQKVLREVEAYPKIKILDPTVGFKMNFYQIYLATRALISIIEQL